MSVKISAIIPAYNEGENIVDFLGKLKSTLQRVSQPYEIIVINDGSADDTGRKAHNCGVKVIDHKENLGYGRSLKNGIRASNGEFIFLIDADGTYDIDAIPKMLRLAEDADMVVGKRIFSQESKDHFKNVTRRFFAYHTSYYAGRKIEDLNSGQRIFRRHHIIDRLDAFPDGFSFTSTITVLYIVEKKNIVYTPINYKHRHVESKFISSSHIFAIAKLAFTLTMKSRPFKLSMQMIGIIAIAALSSKILGSALQADLFVKLLFFAILCPFFFFFFLCYIYARGRMVS